MAIPKISTDAITLSVTAAQPETIEHGLGRQIEGWLVIWRDAPCDFKIAAAAADSSIELVLVPDGTANVRLVLF